MNIIFVCTGNTCRSPMAEGILKHLAPDFIVESRGIQIFPGSETNPYTQKLLKDKDLGFGFLELEFNNQGVYINDEPLNPEETISLL